MRNHFITLILSAFAVFLTACGPDSHHFHIDGRFLKMNQGDFYVYSPDGLINGIDTIHVRGGRFAYEMPCESEGIVVIVLPNFSEIPVFVKPGKSISMKADASHIKDIDITGTDDNEAMTEWRQSIDGMSPPDQQKQAERFIRNNPSSIVSHWLLRKYFMLQTKQDVKKAKELLDIVNKEKKTTPSLAHLTKGIEKMQALQIGERLPSFTATDIYGKTVSSSDYMQGKTIIVIWASWCYDGINVQRMIKSAISRMQREGKGQTVKVLSISLDHSKQVTTQTLQRDSMSWHVVCDEQIWDSPLVSKLGINTIPDNIVLVNGIVVSRHIPMDEIMKEIEK